MPAPRHPALGGAQSRSRSPPARRPLALGPTKGHTAGTRRLGQCWAPLSGWLAAGPVPRRQTERTLSGRDRCQDDEGDEQQEAS